VPEAERNNRTIAERIRAAYHNLPYRVIPKDNNNIYLLPGFYMTWMGFIQELDSQGQLARRSD
jgi:hypothetical protein